MKVALGLKAHSGWAALVSIGRQNGALVVSTRRRIELVDEAWAKQPYHAAEHLEPEPARQLVARGIAMTRRRASLSKQIAALGATVGPPWGKDQKGRGAGGADRARA